MTISAQYVSGHETVHAVQRLRGGTPHVALIEGEARMFEDMSNEPAGTTITCYGEELSEEAILAAFDDPLAPGAYTVLHEIVVRVYQEYGPEAFDALWAASAEDRSTEGLLAAFESVLETTLFEMMAQPSWRCQDRIPGCADLEHLVLTTEGLTISMPERCEPGVTGLEPGQLLRNYVVEIAEPGEVTVSFSDGFGLVQLGACDGFDSTKDYGNWVSIEPVPSSYRLDAGLYRAVVVGDERPAATAHIELVPLQ